MDGLPLPDPKAAEAITDRVDYPLYVVTSAATSTQAGSVSGTAAATDTGAEVEFSGCLAGFVTQCSIVPVRFLICISKQNHTFGVAERSAALGLHLLGADQVETARLFAEETGDYMDKFQHTPWHRGMTGVPVLDHCRAWVEGEVLEHRSVGDHEAFVISVLQGGPGKARDQLTFKTAPDLQPGHPATGGEVAEPPS